MHTKLTGTKLTILFTMLKSPNGVTVRQEFTCRKNSLRVCFLENRNSILLYSRSAILTTTTLKVAKHPRKQSIRESAKFAISPSSSSSSSSSSSNDIAHEQRS